MEVLEQNLCPPPLKIGRVIVDPPTVLAPMAGITDDVFRRIMAEHGAGLVTTEMVSTEGLRRNHKATWRLFTQRPALNAPLAVQIFGSEPDLLAEAARLVEGGGASIIDINAGCPVKKVVKQGAGASLLRETERLARIVEATKRAVQIPVTVKVRLGWDDRSKNPVELARLLASAGVDAITVHGRTAVQQYSGKADWTWIGAMKAAVDVPVIGNGDVTTPALADRMVLDTCCDAVMIGRASMGNPWLFSAIANRWGRRGSYSPNPGLNDFLDTALGHLEEFAKKGPKPAGHFQKILMWYSRGCPDSSVIRLELSKTKEPHAMVGLFREWAMKVFSTSAFTRGTNRSYKEAV